ncbi:hypothetical protein K432DRAFT_385730 [Lepidopterella palustris CBS 459.81]|uniref:Coenzyme Q-binding protein COQ10 START domain-containing protein n=1 Tax=Lepidopterella palustris CBS 459.81 TaxID=1314670 RepID=A0A8E2E2A1_9PEZI|nr:hypothetical protein K432DRAFT_385730 [Lepidopterella palustris CBS 459.81]
MSPVFTAAYECRIHASAAVVWNLLIDISTWPDWNPFVPSADILDSADASSTQTSNEKKIKLGQRLRFHSVMGTQQHTTVERVTVLETPSSPPSPPDHSGTPDLSSPHVYRVGWDLESYPSYLMRTTRDNVVEVGESGAESIYKTKEDFFGPLAWPTKWVAGKKVQMGLEEWAEGLKKAAESGSKIA